MTTPTTGKPYNPLATVELPGGVRRFANEKLQSAIDSAIASMSPEDHFVAVAHHVYTQTGEQVENVTKVSAVVRLPRGFSVAVAGYKDWAKGDLGAEAKAVWRPSW